MNDQDKQKRIEEIQNRLAQIEEEKNKQARIKEIESRLAEIESQKQTGLEKAKDIGLRTVGEVGKVVDLPGGLARSGIAGALETITGKDLVDIKDVMEGKFPESSQILEKLGVPEGYSLSDILPSMYSETGEGLALQKGGFLDPSARGAAGFALDVATDPLTYLSLGTSAIAKPGLKAISKGAETAGKTIYKSAPMIKALDKEAAKINKRFASEVTNLPSNVLMNAGIAGTNEQIAKKSNDLLSTLLEKRNAILQTADEAGATIDVKKAMEPYEQFKNSILSGKDEYKKEAVKKVDSMIVDYKKLGEKPAQYVEQTAFDPETVSMVTKKVEVAPAQTALKPSEMAELNSSFYTKFKDAYKRGDVGKLEDPIIKQQGFGAKKAIEDSVNKAVPGLGDELAKVNADMSALLTVKKKIGTEGTKQGKRFFTEMDAIIGAYDPMIGAAKQVGKLAVSDWARTKAGSGIRKFGLGVGSLADKPIAGGLTESALRQGVWMDMLKQEGREQ